MHTQQPDEDLEAEGGRTGILPAPCVRLENASQIFAWKSVVDLGNTKCDKTISAQASFICFFKSFQLYNMFLYQYYYIIICLVSQENVAVTVCQ